MAGFLCTSLINMTGNKGFIIQFVTWLMKNEFKLQFAKPYIFSSHYIVTPVHHMFTDTFDHKNFMNIGHEYTV